MTGRRHTRFRPTIFGFGLLILLALVSASYANRILEIPATTEHDIISLEHLGVRLLDAKVEKINPALHSQPRRVRWNFENGYVTGLADNETLMRLNQAGISYQDKGSYIPRARRNPQQTILQISYQWGWPRPMTGWPAVYGHTALVADFDGNGDLEVQLSNIENYFYIWQHDGAFFPGYPLSPIIMWLPTDPPTPVTWVSSSSIETAAMGDIDGDGTQEIVYGCGLGYLCAYQPNGSMDSYPWLMDTTLYSGVPALVDLDGIEGDEIIVHTYPYYPEAFPIPPMVHVFYPDHTEMQGWPKLLPRESDSSPAVGDLDGDGDPEVVIGCADPGTGDGQILVWHTDGTMTQGFPISNLYRVSSTPTIADLDGDGYREIIVRCKSHGSEINGIYVWDYTGDLVPGFPAEVITGHPDGACAVGDIDGDGDLEIAFGSIEAVDLGRIYAWHHDGTPVQGFPQFVGATWVEGSVTIADVSGDGLPDIIGTTNGLLSDYGHVVAFDWQGNMVADFPLFPDVNDEFSSFECTPTTADLDGDGDIEIFAGNHEGKLYVWDTPGLVSEYETWPTFKFGPHRTGCRATEPVSAIPETPSPVAETFKLLAPYPNPFNSTVRISFDMSSSLAKRASLAIYNCLGQEVARFHGSVLQQSYIDWRADDLPSGLYFARLTAANHTHAVKLALIK
ncbi:T9SS type A sorting domain-containing protein [bacterium]|nr:T9SS type A sorting domain-containing protein [bacterium]